MAGKSSFLRAGLYTEVITRPARRATVSGWRLTVEPALVDRLLTETAEGADALPLLALTLERLYRSPDPVRAGRVTRDAFDGGAAAVQGRF